MNQNSRISQLFADVSEHLLYLKELGVEDLSVQLPVFAKIDAPPATPDSAPPESGTERLAGSEKQVGARPPVALDVRKKNASEAKPRPGSRIKALPSLAERPSPDVLKSAAGSQRSSSAAPVAASEPTATRPAAGNLFEGGDPTIPSTSETIEEIRRDIGNCTRCPLHEGRTKIVHTAGNFEAELMFVGEAPGADEDAKGEPFVGRAGKLLTQIIEAIGYRREDVVIGNINRCRPPGNRQPTLPEAHTCRPFLLREIAIIKPKVIVVLGNTAMHNLLDTKVGITKMRGQFHDYFNVKVMPTFHPAYLLRDPRKKREVWEDMKLVRDYLATLR